MKHFLSAGLMALVTLGSSVASAQEPAAADDHNDTIVRGLYGMGVAFLVAPYPLLAVTATVGVTSGHKDMAWLYMPVAGPFIAVRENDVSTGAAVAMIATGIIQSMGVGLLIAAPFVDAAEDPATESALIIAPSVTPTSASLTVGMTF